MKLIQNKYFSDISDDQIKSQIKCTEGTIKVGNQTAEIKLISKRTSTYTINWK